MHRVILRVDADEIAIELDGGSAPGLTDAIVRSMPHATLAVHCQVAGAEFCVPVPFFHWHENRRIPSPGDVGYASFGNYLCFYYGEMAADDGPTNVVGRIASSSASLGSLGRRLLKQGARRAYLHDPAAPRSTALALPPAGRSRMATLSRTLLQSTLTDPPGDVMHLRSAVLPAMGNIAGRLQASVLLLSLAEVMMNARTLALDASASLGGIAASLTHQMARYARWLAMAGLPGVADWLTTVRDVIHENAQDVGTIARDLDEALVAIARLRFWVEAISPWHKVDADYRISDAVWSSVMSNVNDESRS
jgi:hypothetical protein